MRCRRPLIPTFVIAAAAVAVLAAGCGGGSSPPTGSATAAGNVGKQFVAFAVCMRSHGVPGYPDPEVSTSGNRVQVTISPGSADPNSPIHNQPASSRVPARDQRMRGRRARLALDPQPTSTQLLTPQTQARPEQPTPPGCRFREAAAPLAGHRPSAPSSGEGPGQRPCP